MMNIEAFEYLKIYKKNISKVPNDVREKGWESKSPKEAFGEILIEKDRKKNIIKLGGYFPCKIKTKIRACLSLCNRIRSRDCGYFFR